MTGLDVLVAAMLSACVDHPPVITEQSPRVEAQVYECPLMGNDAKFVVWRRICSRDEKNTVIVRDVRTGRGWVINQFLGIDTAFEDTRGMDVYSPNCRTEEPLVKG